MRISKLLSSASTMLVSFCVMGAEAQEAPQCQNVRFAEVGWTDITATTALSSTVLKALGYNPSSTILSLPDTFKNLKSKQVDAFLGYWSPSQTPVVAPFLKSGDIKMVPHPNLVGAKYTLAVPAYAAAGGLKSFADLAKYKDKLGYTIYGIEPGNDGNKLINDMISKNQFGLGDFMVAEWGERGMLMEVKKAISEKRWIAFLAWEPHPMNVDFNLTYLKGGDAIFGANYGEAKVFTLMSSDYQTRCPNVGKLLGNLQFTLDMENRVMGSIMSKSKPLVAAKDWLKQNPAVLKNWLNGVTTFDGKDALPAVMSAIGA
ncbi:choline ABC transporter substrate-binding protein [Leeia oryzae]|uniref:choline ABC transporter substrate-binding protein n=1 Tax=Leeia oryzae TaxID=356662 RepID=UPI0004775804|nr:choline ABC transporter substrate-binding protein [Leeia oryzae]